MGIQDKIPFTWFVVGLRRLKGTRVFTVQVPRFSSSLLVSNFGF